MADDLSAAASGAGGFLLEARDVEFSYGAKKVLKGVSLGVPPGKLMGLLGPNGSGKTTLFKCCLAFQRPEKGDVLLNGRSVRSLSPKELAVKIAYVPQEHRPAFPYTVREMVAMGRTPHMGMRPTLTRRDGEIVDRSLELAGISSLADENYNHLSGGQRQLTLVARALAQETSLVFLDEPTSSLDFRNQMRVWGAVRELVKKGSGAVICCHDPNHILWFCDEAAVLKDGRLLAKGPSRQVVTTEILDELYGGEARKFEHGDKIFIYPRSAEDKD
ncbi:MAG: ABC transporter ATP-binding protein [Deltaproteobacteria bacterium]|jgi:iron complex transport system ATP-binding protein|nr:ABC transporter ATP-binding protein [Deltaproteobacteria bacterium]